MLLFITFCIIVGIQIFFYLFLFGAFSFSKVKNGIATSFPVSIVICAKNEEVNLQKFLPKIASQKYTSFEIILVDDASSDNSLSVMLDFKKNFSSNKISIQIISIDEKSSKGKKAALTLGIKSSQYDYILLTDADCYPVSNYWIQEMHAYFTNQKTIVLGYGAYRKIEKSFLNKIIRFETLLTAIQYFSYAKIGKPYMGVGRNIAYHKKEFMDIDGFKDHEHIHSGDDDLFINQIANFNNTSICFKKDSFTISEPKIDFKEWIHQKRRHITTSSHYKGLHKFLLGLFYLTQISFWVFSILLLALQINVALTLSLIFCRWVIWYLVISKSAIKLNEKDLVSFAPIFEISIIFIQLFIFIKNIISPPKHW